MQIDATLLGVVASLSTLAKIWTGFKLCATTPNNILQKSVQTHTTCNIQPMSVGVVGQQCCVRLLVVEGFVLIFSAEKMIFLRLYFENTRYLI